MPTPPIVTDEADLVQSPTAHDRGGTTHRWRERVRTKRLLPADGTRRRQRRQSKTSPCWSQSWYPADLSFRDENTTRGSWINRVDQWDSRPVNNLEKRRVSETSCSHNDQINPRYTFSSLKGCKVLITLYPAQAFALNNLSACSGSGGPAATRRDNPMNRCLLIGIMFKVIWCLLCIVSLVWFSYSHVNNNLKESNIQVSRERAHMLLCCVALWAPSAGKHGASGGTQQRKKNPLWRLRL